MRRFRQKHPYLFWQLIGWGILAVAVGFLFLGLVDVHSDFLMLLLVLLVILGSGAIFVSPPIIWCRNRPAQEERARTARIFALYSQTHKAVTAIMVIATLLLFLAAAGVALRFGLVPLMVLAVYPAAIPYLLYTRAMKRWFYQIPNAEQYCHVRDLAAQEELEQFTRMPALVFFGVDPDKQFLRFIYHYFEKCGALKQQEIHLLRVPCSWLRQMYDLSFLEETDHVLCITEAEIHITEDSEVSFQPHCELFSRWVGESQWRNVQLPFLVKSAFRSRGSGGEAERYDFAARSGVSAFEEELLMEELSEICRQADRLSKRVRHNKLRAAEACDALRTGFPFLSTEDAQEILALAAEWQSRR